jgi:hypothetical protein
VLITRNDAIFDFTGIKVPVLFQYSFTGGKIVPFVNGGFAYQRFTKKSFLQISEVENTTSHEVRTYVFKTFVVPDGEISAIAGLGLRTRIFNNINLFVQGRIEVGQGALQKSNDYSTSSEKPFKHNSIQSTLLLGIAF